MSRLIWSPAALLDVQRLYRFLAPKNIDAAKRAVTAIRQGVRVLGQQPGIGRPIDEMPDEFREWIIDFGDSGYVARYRFDSNVVTILTVRHQKEVGD
jgi:plasmid stabilization system protein ParE